jgi:hypothetical protein
MKEIAIALTLIFSLLIIPQFVISYKSAVIQARRAACFSMSSSIQEAVDSCLIEDEKDLSMIEPLDLNALAAKGKLKRIYKCPVSGEYRVRMIKPDPQATDQEAEYLVYCTFHGEKNQTIPGKTDPGYSWFHWFMEFLRSIF